MRSDETPTRKANSGYRMYVPTANFLLVVGALKVCIYVFVCSCSFCERSCWHALVVC